MAGTCSRPWAVQKGANMAGLWLASGFLEGSLPPRYEGSLRPDCLCRVWLSCLPAFLQGCWDLGARQRAPSD